MIDASGPDGRERAERVNEVLAGIDAGHLPQIEIMNKVDRRAGPAPGAERDDTGAVRRVWLSARTGEGIEALSAALGERFETTGPSRELRLPPGSGRMRARLYETGAVLGSDRATTAARSSRCVSPTGTSFASKPMRGARARTRRRLGVLAAKPGE